VSIQSYFEFADQVRFNNRYVLNDACREFLEGLCDEATSRLHALEPGDSYYRAQLNTLDDLQKVFEHADPINVPLPPERMVPRGEFVGDGRVNPRGIAYLYLADSEQTAVAEMRPVKGDVLTIAAFAVNKTTHVIDCRMRDGQNSDWSGLNFALSFPANRGESWRSYLPTQCVAEYFRDRGFSGLLYRSSMNDDGYNIALFDIESAQIKSRGLRRVRGATYRVERDEIFPRDA
jgi:RES domain-containing protein